MATERQHAVDPRTLADGTLVEISNGEGEKSFLVFINGEGFEWQRKNVGLRYPSKWGNYRIVRVYDPREVWEKIDRPTEEHVGRVVRCVIDGVTEYRGRIGEVRDASPVRTPSGWLIGFADSGKWYVLVEPEPTDPEAKLVEKVKLNLIYDFFATEAELNEAARAIIAAVREAGEQA